MQSRFLSSFHNRWFSVQNTLSVSLETVPEGWMLFPIVYWVLTNVDPKVVFQGLSSASPPTVTVLLWQGSSLFSLFSLVPVVYKWSLFKNRLWTGSESCSYNISLTHLVLELEVSPNQTPVRWLRPQKVCSTCLPRPFGTAHSFYYSWVPSNCWNSSSVLEPPCYQ